MSPVQNLNNRVLLFPDKGSLLVCSDVHGNKEDYLHMVGIFLDQFRQDKETYLLFLGDLVHGPQVAQRERFTYVDESEFIMDHFMDMVQTYSGNVFTLLGNHEHGHVGGVHTGKFCTDEVLELENKVGVSKASTYREFMGSFPLIALTQTGVAFTHGAPSATIGCLDDLLNVLYSGHENKTINQMYDVPILDLLWKRCATDQETDAFFSSIRLEGYESRVVIYGHDIVEEGFAVEGVNRGILSTSFGVPDVNKLYLRLDLGARYGTITDLQDKKILCQFWEFEKWYVEDGRYQFAEKAIAQKKYDAALFSLEHGEEDYQRYFLLGKTCLLKSSEMQGNFLDRALTYFERSLDLLSSFAPTHYMMAQCYELKGLHVKQKGEKGNVQKKIGSVGEIFLKALQHYRSAETDGLVYNTLVDRQRVQKEMRSRLL